MEILVVLILAVAGFAVFFFVVKRLLRMALRVALLGAVLFAVLLGGLAWWWYDPLGSGGPARTRENRNTTARPTRAR